MTTSETASGLLKADHQNIKQLFREWEHESEGTEKSFDLMNRCIRDLEIHSQIEEEIFYPECRRLWVSHAGIIDHYQEDHYKIDAQIRHIRARGRYANWEDFRPMMNDVFVHFAEEDRRFLAILENIISIEESMRLGDRLRARKVELQHRPELRRSRAA